MQTNNQIVTLVYKGEGSLRINVTGYPSLDLAKGAKHVFDSAISYKPYSKAAGEWNKSGLLDIIVGDVAPTKEVKKVEVKKEEPKVEVKKEEPKEEVKVEVKKEEAPAPSRGRKPSHS